MMSKTEIFTLDSLAMRLAADMGQAWQDMCAFPGYMRNIWRDEARQRVLTEMPEAVFEVVPCPWEGVEVEYIVKVAAPR